MAFFLSKMKFFKRKISYLPRLNSIYIYKNKFRKKGGAYLSHFSSLREIKIDRIKIKNKIVATKMELMKNRLDD